MQYSFIFSIVRSWFHCTEFHPKKYYVSGAILIAEIDGVDEEKTKNDIEMKWIYIKKKYILFNKIYNNFR